jgi:Tfp pilus assembly PilM family ATPase
MPEYTRIGVACGGEALRCVEVRREGKGIAVRGVTEIPLPVPLTLEHLLEPNRMEEVRRAVRLHRAVGNQAQTELAASLGAGLYFVHLFPVDADLHGAEFDEQVEWELRQSVAQDLDSYNFGAEKLATNVGLVDLAVAAAVRKEVVRALRSTLEGTFGRLICVEADVFSACRAFEANYDADPLRPTLLLGTGQRACCVAAVVKQEVRAIAIWPQPEDSADRSATERAGYLRDVIDRFARTHDLSRSLGDLAGIFLYGEGVDEEFIEALRDSCEAKVLRLDPFLRNRPQETGRGEWAVGVHPEAFATALGAALW